LLVLAVSKVKELDDPQEYNKVFDMRRESLQQSRGDNPGF